MFCMVKLTVPAIAGISLKESPPSTVGTKINSGVRLKEKKKSDNIQTSFPVVLEGYEYNRGMFKESI